MLNFSVKAKEVMPALVYFIAVLASIFLLPEYSFLFTGVLLFAPFLDKVWCFPALKIDRKKASRWAICSVAILGVSIIAEAPDIVFSLNTFFLTALPEEWFFRGYLMTRLGKDILGNKLQANLVSSIAFSVLHLASRGWAVAVEVFFPSFILGWLYQKTDDLVLCVLVHTFFNVLYVSFVNEYMEVFRTFIFQIAS